MKNNPQRKHPAGYTSLLVVFTISIFMLTLMVFAYRRAANAQATLADIQVKTDYREKEEAMLRSIVALTPNRAIKVMQDGSGSTQEKRDTVGFLSIFTDALDRANARTSISPELLTAMNVPGSIMGNSGDSALGSPSRIFNAVSNNSGKVSSGLNRDLGTGFPPALNDSGSVTDSDFFPIISNLKKYGSFASGKVALSTDIYKDYNLIPYPDIDFGYAKPGELFVAKRNWWAFRMNLASHDQSLTNLSNFDRTFVLSIYEIPSQLPISGSAFMALGQYADGQAWDNVTISGNVFAGRALVEGAASFSSLSSRRGMELSETATIGGQTFTQSPFTPGVRESYRLTEGDFFPVSLSSESGRAAFVPINRGRDYFDRFSHVVETNTISPTTWNQYSVGALECAMRLDISECVSSTDPTPTELTFSYMRGGVRQSLVMPLDNGVTTNLPVGYLYRAEENETTFFPTPVDVAYGKNGSFFYKSGVSGTIRYDNDSFGDPLVGTLKTGYYKPLYPFEVKNLPNGRICVTVYPERFKDFMGLLGADGLHVNHSLAVNVDYPGSTNLNKPSIPATINDYGVILEECADLSDFTEGFSLVTNLRLFIGDDFNVVPVSPPADYTPPSGTFYPPASLFAPEKRYGSGMDPLAVEFTGSFGSAASEGSETAIRPLETTTVSGQSMNSSSRLSINLSTISHPAELPPITMKNWLIVLEEKGREFN
jgi:hypothetical protein